MKKGTSVVPPEVVEKSSLIDKKIGILKLIFAYGTFMNSETNICWPGTKALRARSGIRSQSTFYEAIYGAEDLEMISRYPYPRKKGGHGVVTRWYHTWETDGLDSRQPPTPDDYLETELTGCLETQLVDSLDSRQQTHNRTTQGTDIYDPEGSSIILSESLRKSLPELSENERSFWIPFSQVHYEVVGGAYEPHKTDFGDVEKLLGQASVEDVLDCLDLFPDYWKKARSKGSDIDFCIRAFYYACTSKGHLLNEVQKEYRQAELRKEREERERMEAEKQARERAENEQDSEWLRQEIQGLEQSRLYMLKHHGPDSGGYASQTALMGKYQEKLRQLEQTRNDNCEPEEQGVG